MYTDSFEKIIGPLSEAEKKNAPPVIFSEGDISFLKLPIISIIGSRKGHLSNETATLGISLGSKCCSFIRRNAMTDLLCFFIYHWFCHTPALPDGLKAEAAASGMARYHRFIEMLKRKRLGGESLAKCQMPTLSYGVKLKEALSAQVKPITLLLSAVLRITWLKTQRIIYS